jgi:thiol-disulfide isomerase/thioredoxin
MEVIAYSTAIMTTQKKQMSKLGSLWPLMLAGLFMLVGIMILIYIGRDTARLMNANLDEIDLSALLDAEKPPSIPSLYGKIAVFHFWGTWNADCRKEFPAFMKVYSRFASNPQIEFVSVSCSSGIENDLESLRQETSNFLVAQEVKMPTYADTALYTRGKITRMLASGGLSYPFTMVLDGQGTVREYWVGPTSDAMEQLPKIIERLLAETAPN